jgi:hypothetical protein
LKSALPGLVGVKNEASNISEAKHKIVPEPLAVLFRNQNSALVVNRSLIGPE